MGTNEHLQFNRKYSAGMIIYMYKFVLWRNIVSQSRKNCILF